MDMNMYVSCDTSFLTEVRMNNSFISSATIKKQNQESGGSSNKKAGQVQNAWSNQGASSNEEIITLKAPLWGKKNKSSTNPAGNGFTSNELKIKNMSKSNWTPQSEDEGNWSPGIQESKASPKLKDKTAVRVQPHLMQSSLKMIQSNGEEEKRNEKSEENLDDWEQDLLAQSDSLEQGSFTSLSQKMAQLNGNSSYFASKKPF